jgi:hypothetical protein
MQMATGVEQKQQQQQQHHQLLQQTTYAQRPVNRVVLPFVLLVTVFNYISRTNLEYGGYRQISPNCMHWIHAASQMAALHLGRH